MFGCLSRRKKDEAYFLRLSAALEPSTVRLRLRRHSQSLQKYPAPRNQQIHTACQAVRKEAVIQHKVHAEVPGTDSCRSIKTKASIDTTVKAAACEIDTQSRTQYNPSCER